MCYSTSLPCAQELPWASGGSEAQGRAHVPGKFGCCQAPPGSSNPHSPYAWDITARRSYLTKGKTKGKPNPSPFGCRGKKNPREKPSRVLELEMRCTDCKITSKGTTLITRTQTSLKHHFNTLQIRPRLVFPIHSGKPAIAHVWCSQRDQTGQLFSS